MEFEVSFKDKLGLPEIYSSFKERKCTPKKWRWTDDGSGLVTQNNGP